MYQGERHMQILAMLTMLIDHIGVVFYPDNVALRAIGRLAMPFYAYALVLGYQRTSNLPRYMLRLAVIGIISQVPYHLAFLGPDEPFEVNVVGTLLISLLALAAIDRVQRRPFGVYAIAAILAAACALLELIRFDYGAYLLALVFIYRYSRGTVTFALHFLLDAAYMTLRVWEIQIFSLLSTAMIVYAPRLLRMYEGLAVPRWLWRSFYPAHLAALALLAYWL